MALVLSETGEDGVRTLTLNSPKTLNAMSYELVGELLEYLAEIREDGGSTAVVITGAGRGFCSGAELGAMGDRIGQDGFGDGVAHFMDTVCSPVVEAIQAMPVPVIAAVNGPAVGGGVGLALSCHIVVAGQSAYFGLPFLPKLGLMPDMGATWFLPRFIGRSRALAMAILGERLSAEEACRIGMVHSYVNDEALLDEAASIARRAANLPEGVFQHFCEALQLSENNTLTEQLAYEARVQGKLIEGPAFREGVARFLRKA